MLPFNIASYALLAYIIGKLTNMVPKGIIGDLSNVHIYKPHLNAVKKQLNRDVNKYSFPNFSFMSSFYTALSKGKLDDKIDSMHINDFVLEDYISYPKIPAEMLPYNK